MCFSRDAEHTCKAKHAQHHLQNQHTASVRIWSRSREIDNNNRRHGGEWARSCAERALELKHTHRAVCVRANAAALAWPHYCRRRHRHRRPLSLPTTTIGGARHITTQTLSEGLTPCTLTVHQRNTHNGGGCVYCLRPEPHLREIALCHRRGRGRHQRRDNSDKTSVAGCCGETGARDARESKWQLLVQCRLMSHQMLYVRTRRERERATPYTTTSADSVGGGGSDTPPIIIWRHSFISSRSIRSTSPSH